MWGGGGYRGGTKWVKQCGEKILYPPRSRPCDPCRPKLCHHSQCPTPHPDYYTPPCAGGLGPDTRTCTVAQTDRQTETDARIGGRSQPCHRKMPPIMIMKNVQVTHNRKELEEAHHQIKQAYMDTTVNVSPRSTCREYRRGGE